MPESPKACWSCGAARAPTDALCPSCGKVQPPPQPEGVVDRFAVMGLPRSYELDERALEETFRSLSRKLHPDRFARATPRERRFSLEQTTLLNDAYRTLKDPVRRAEHLLSLRGVKDSPRMSPEFLEQTLDDRERLDEAKASGQPLDEMAAAVRERRDRTLQQVREIVTKNGNLREAAEL